MWKKNLLDDTWVSRTREIILVLEFLVTNVTDRISPVNRRIFKSIIVWVVLYVLFMINNIIFEGRDVKKCRRQIPKKPFINNEHNVSAIFIYKQDCMKKKPWPVKKNSKTQLLVLILINKYTHIYIHTYIFVQSK